MSEEELEESTQPITTEGDTSANVAFEEMTNELETLKLQNHEKFSQMQSMGAQLDPMSIVLTRLEMLLDMFLSPAHRLVYELRFEQEMASQLDEGLKQVSRSKLLQGMEGGLPPHPLKMPR